MASNIPPPADHSALFSDPAELAREYQRLADVSWDKAGRLRRKGYTSPAENELERFERLSAKTRKYHSMARNGEKITEF